MSLPIIARYFKQKNIKNGVIVSLIWEGSAGQGAGERLKMPLAIIDKRRPEPNVAEIMNVIGDVEGKEAIMIDDLIDTAGTITMGAEELLRRGQWPFMPAVLTLSYPAPPKSASCSRRLKKSW